MCNALSHILFCLFLTIGLMDRAFAMEVAFVEVSALSSEREREEGFRLMRGFLLTEYAVDPSGELLSADEELMQFFRDPEDYQKKRIAYEVVRVFYEGVLQAIDSVDQGEIPVYKQDIVMRVKQGCKLVVKATSYDELCALRLSISEDEQELPSIREIIDRLDSFVLKPEAARLPVFLKKK